MKNFLIVISVIAIITIAGSVFYYFVVFLPQQSQKPIKAQLDTKSLIMDINKELNCELQMQGQMAVWLEERCPSNTKDISGVFDCRLSAMMSPEFGQKFNCLGE